jgi:hypothetical protein
MYVLLDGQATLFFKKNDEDWEKEKNLTLMGDVMDYDYFSQLLKSINSPEISKYKHELYENILYRRIHPDELILMRIDKTQEYF